MTLMMLFFLMFFIALAAQVFFIEGYYKNRALNPIFISSLTIALSFATLVLVSLIKQAFFEIDFSDFKVGDVFSDSALYGDGDPPRFFSYVSAVGYGVMFSGISVLCFFLYTYYTVKLDKDIRNITDINFGFQKGIENIINKLNKK